MSSMLPPGLGALPSHPPMPGGGMLPPPGLGGLHQPPQPAAHEDSGLQVLQDTIESFPPLLHALSDAADVNDAVKALHLLTGVQKRLMGQAPGGASQAPR